VQAVTIPRLDLYATDECLTVEWYVDDVEYRSVWNLVDVSENSEIDDETAAVMSELAVVDETVSVIDDWQFQDVPGGVLWVVDQIAYATATPDPEEEDDAGERREYGGGFA
jgi:hypothetical protein